MGLMDKLAAGIERFADEADKAIDKGKTKVGEMQTELQMDGLAKKLGYLVFDFYRGREVDQAQRQKILDELSRLEDALFQKRAEAAARAEADAAHKAQQTDQAAQAAQAAGGAEAAGAPADGRAAAAGPETPADGGPSGDAVPPADGGPEAASPGDPQAGA